MKIYAEPIAHKDTSRIKHKDNSLQQLPSVLLCEVRKKSKTTKQYIRLAYTAQTIVVSPLDKINLNNTAEIKNIPP